MNISIPIDRRKAKMGQCAHRKGDHNIIEVKGEKDKEQEVTVRHVAIPIVGDSPLWGGHEEFKRKWSEGFINKKPKIH